MTSPYCLTLPENIPAGTRELIPEIHRKTGFSSAILPISAIDFSKEISQFITSLQNHGCAVLISISPEQINQGLELLEQTQADGLHMETPDNFKSIRSSIPKDKIAGVFCGLSRHEVMVCGEAGADYIAYGPDNFDEKTDMAPIYDFTRWYFEVIEIPGMAWDAFSLDQIEGFLANGADFVAFGTYLWSRNSADKNLDEILKILPSDHAA